MSYLKNLALVLLIFGCTKEIDNAPVSTLSRIDLGDEAQTLQANAGVTFQFSKRFDGTQHSFTIDCPVPSDPDAVGVVLELNAPTLGIDRSVRFADYYRWTGKSLAGEHQITAKVLSGQARCQVASLSLPATCTASQVFHSANADHGHVEVGSELQSLDDMLPVSGDHYPIWMAWNVVYAHPVMTGHLIHNLEHGGLVLSHRDDEDAPQLKKAFDLFSPRRKLLTPDPTQTTRYAVRAWRWGYEADCYSEAEILEFMNSHFQQGREDEDSDPPRD
jgi:hypothetical protein